MPGRLDLWRIFKWTALAAAVLGYAVFYFAARAGVCLMPYQHLQKEDYLFLGLKWIYEDTNKANRQTTVDFYTKDGVLSVPNSGKFTTPIRTKDEAVRFAASYDGCCAVRPGAASEEVGGFFDSLIGKKIYTTEIVYFPDGPMEFRQRETYTVYVSLTKCGEVYDVARGQLDDTAKWLKKSANQGKKP